MLLGVALWRSVEKMGSILIVKVFSELDWWKVKLFVGDAHNEDDLISKDVGGVVIHDFDQFKDVEGIGSVTIVGADIAVLLVELDLAEVNTFWKGFGDGGHEFELVDTWVLSSVVDHDHENEPDGRE